MSGNFNRRVLHDKHHVTFLSVVGTNVGITTEDGNCYICAVEMLQHVDAKTAVDITDSTIRRWFDAAINGNERRTRQRVNKFTIAVKLRRDDVLPI